MDILRHEGVDLQSHDLSIRGQAFKVYPAWLVVVWRFEPRTHEASDNTTSRPMAPSAILMTQLRGYARRIVSRYSIRFA